MDQQEIAARLGPALLLGGLIGFERQWRPHIARLRTNTLVAIGANGFVAFSAPVSDDTVRPGSLPGLVPGIASSAPE
jgi:putative Mg2+ transporter-C (MgtC) family protein